MAAATVTTGGAFQPGADMVLGGSLRLNAPTGGGLGYAEGAGAAVTQITNRSTGVTINTLSGLITTDSTSLAAGAEATFIVTNSQVAIGDVPVVASRSGQVTGLALPQVSAVAAGSFSITVTNLSASADTGAMLINFLILKAVSA